MRNAILKSYGKGKKCEMFPTETKAEWDMHVQLPSKRKGKGKKKKKKMSSNVKHNTTCFALSQSSHGASI